MSYDAEDGATGHGSPSSRKVEGSHDTDGTLAELLHNPQGAARQAAFSAIRSSITSGFPTVVAAQWYSYGLRSSLMLRGLLNLSWPEVEEK